MKKITQKELELISAYLDGELSENEIEEIENRINESAEFKSEYEKLKRIKDLTSSAYSRIPQSEYFETRVMQKINSGNNTKSKVRKWIPTVGITALTLALMLILKFNPGILDQLVEQQKTTLAGFYKQNLQPLLFAANLTNEDIFNFAFNKQLPLDKSRNQFIHLGTDSTGREYFEIKEIPETKPENNLQRFVTAMDLNERQKNQVDSIINSYASELQSQILVNENSTVAINPNLWNYNKALVADLLAFAEKSNQKQYVKLVPLNYRDINQLKVVNAVNEIKSNRNDDYIFITPDTVFSDKYYFNKDQFKKDMQNMRKDLEKAKKDVKNLQFNFDFNADSNKYKYKSKFDTAWAKNFQILIDSNICRVNVPRVVLPPDMPKLDSIFSNMHLEKLSEMMKNFSFEMPKDFPTKGGDFKFKFGTGDSVHSFKVNVPPINVDSIVRESLKSLDSLDFKMPKNFYFNYDSLKSKNYYRRHIDKQQMKEIQDEIQKEMEKMRKELKKNKIDKPSLEEKKDTVKT
jgi:hypothetical protein